MDHVRHSETKICSSFGSAWIGDAWSGLIPVTLEQASWALFLHSDALSHACNASFHGVRISTEYPLKFLTYPPSAVHVPSIPYSLR
jgi:hypothetical protein